MRKTCIGLAGLIVVTVWLLAGCGETLSSVKQAVSSATASSSVSVTPSATPPTQAESSAASAPATSGQGAAPGAQPGATPTATTASGSGFPWGWFWLALGIALAVGLALWGLIARFRRRASAATDWRIRVIDAYAKGAALHDAMAAAETPGAMTAADAALRWTDIQRRADDYSQLLYVMQQAAPGDPERILVADVLAAMQAARSAMGSERSAGSDGRPSGIAHDRIEFFASSLRSLHEADVRPA